MARRMRCFAVAAVSMVVIAGSVQAQSTGSLSLPPDSPKWELAGRASVGEFQGRQCLMLDGGTASIRDLMLGDGIIDLDVGTSAPRGFFGVQFRSDSANGEFVYLRQHKSGMADAMQYTPIFNTGLNWQLYSGPGFIGAVPIPRDTWFHLRLVISGATARLYVGDTTAPALTMPDLKTGIRTGQVGLVVLMGATCFSNVTIRSLPPTPFTRQVTPMPQGTIVRWALSPSYNALERDLEKPLTPVDVSAMKWEQVEAESPGIVPINRYRASPHPRVTFQSNFATRLNAQPGTEVVYARTVLRAERAEVCKLQLGYSDEVTVFLNGQALFRGRSAQSFRDPGFLGIVDVENDAVFLPMRQGDNELVIAVAELGGGWGFVTKLVGCGAVAR